jgi:hypothetical protein
MLRSRLCSLLVISCSLGAARLASAQPAEGNEAPPASTGAFNPDRVFVEVNGNWGPQLGQQDYVPNGTPTATKAPLTNGFGLGATGGFAISKDFELLVDYTRGYADSRNGYVMGALSQVDGSIVYDAFAAGARMGHRLGPGRIYGQLALGVVMPFSTKVTYDYAPTVAALGLTGTGTETANYGTGIGAHGEFGYHVAIAQGVYLGASLRLQAFQSSNDGQITRYSNFVTDFSNPRPITVDVMHGTTSAATPENYSVQDARFHLALGYDF